MDLVLKIMFWSGLSFEGDMIPFMREKDAKVSSALTQQRRNACSVAKRMFETFASPSPGKGITIPSNLKPDRYNLTSMKEINHISFPLKS